MPDQAIKEWRNPHVLTKWSTKQLHVQLFVFITWKRKASTTPDEAFARWHENTDGVPFLATLTLASFMLLGWRMETVNRKKVPAWNISQQALWIFNNTVMTSGKRHCCWLFQMCFFLLSFFWLLLLWAPKDCFFSFLKKKSFSSAGT